MVKIEVTNVSGYGGSGAAVQLAVHSSFIKRKLYVVARESDPPTMSQ